MPKCSIIIILTNPHYSNNKIYINEMKITHILNKLFNE